MRRLEVFIVYSTLFFGAYTEYRANQFVSKMKKDKIETVREAPDSVFMTRALELSRLALQQHHGFPFGSVVVKDGKIIGEGYDKSVLYKDTSAHAEVEAIKNASRKINSIDLQGAVIYTSAQPCPMCLSLIHLTGISKVYYCISHDKIEKYNDDLSAKHIADELRIFRADRMVPELQILGDVADKYIDSYSKQ